MRYQEHEKVMDFISEVVQLTEQDKNAISTKLTAEHYAKGDFVLKADERAKTLKFVVSGIYRVYHIRDGKEITSYFNYSERNPLVSSFRSLLKRTPSKEYIECISDGKLLSISYSEWENLYSRSEAINTFGRIMAEKNYLLAVERIESLQYKSATDRYNDFITLYPNLLNLIPHHYISSYLGITPESLSRIRKQIIS